MKNSGESDDQQSLPPIPDKRYFTISEAAKLCSVKPHVLRYWEQEFLQLKPSKRRGNRRYYQYKDVLMIRQIRTLLYENGFTIEGAKAQLTHNSASVSQTVHTDAVVQKVIADLENVLQRLKETEYL
ncbi:MAG: MerR family transcriptional regulator [Gammaproteobacteria bacterium]|nr:MerR family transcriptional regulator [Gammaproteobacteria bacterium]